MESTLREYKSPRQHVPHLLFCSPLVSNFLMELFCKQSPVYGVFWPLVPHPSTDRNETRTWSSLSPQKPSHKIWCTSVHNYLVIVVTDGQTDRHTNQRRWQHIPSLLTLDFNAPASTCVYVHVNTANDPLRLIKFGLHFGPVTLCRRVCAGQATRWVLPHISM